MVAASVQHGVPQTWESSWSRVGDPRLVSETHTRIPTHMRFVAVDAPEFADVAVAGGVRDALEAVGIGVAATTTRCVIEVKMPTDRHVSRYGVAKLILHALGDEAFSDQYEFVLDGESLSSELIDAVCASVMDHAV